ncbi:acetoin utilization AcuB family protein [Effusibacillus lacus]|uniref:Acetoin utilization protein AcuB n=1 Tax=Effusibacillus lacus TaxID=1348429 RepID=A0A292YRI3_9BACL|nr:acetoin utilization AcuB family protein [Effusibacillus lacus]TCS70083.1 acetoin utilization protein AcuB [Effusibacillus lacus]GAX91080.1 acetoin utilization protein AcuB [Effusibacillus lacus]
MLVEQAMTTDVICVTPETPIEEALAITTVNRIRHLPVVKDGELVGIISDRDLRNAMPSCLIEEECEVLKDTPVGSIMKTNVTTAHPLDFVEDAANILYQKRIGCLPVVSCGKVVGIITERDILHTLVEMMGVSSPTSRVEVQVPDRPGMLAEVADILRARQMNAASVMVFPSPTPGQKTIVLRLKTMDPRRFISDVENAGYKVVQPPALG